MSRPDADTQAAPISRPPGFFARYAHELTAGTFAGLVSFAVYAWTAAPNVTLLDSGEFIVAAQHFGVPHPTGYPLWTILAWAFQLLPLGNAAWEINIFSGVCGALAVALAAGMLTNLLRWFLESRLAGRMRALPALMGISFALMLAFSVSMWSQAVIAEVYTLHALVIGIFLALLYAWVKNPRRDALMLWAFFVLALSFSNHHLTLTLAPLPYLLILLLRRRALPDWIFAGTLTVLLGYLGFAILSEDPLVLKTAIRLFWIVAAAGSVFVWWRRMRVRWRLVAFLPFAVAAGLLPYAYMPFASSTNPPMNWGYTRENRGFFYSINRTQYSGSLSDQSLRALGRVTGTSALRKKRESTPNPEARDSGVRLWIGFFWRQLALAFTPFAVLGYFASIVFILRAGLAQRAWIYCLHIAFVLAAFLQPVLDGARIDAAGWWLQMPYHTYTNWIFALLSGLGTGLLIAWLAGRRAVYFWLAPASLILPVLTFVGSEPHASQRDRWFGWQFGHDILKDLPRGSVVIGGTDPGRFVPTYMIFGESGQDPSVKRNPDFDRRDLYIITQNALGDPYYMDYIRDHYGRGRPQASTWLEKALGRETAYPEKPLILPDFEAVKEIVREAAEGEDGKPLEEDPNILVFSSVLKWIWEKNRDEHDFFVEESFPITWTYDYAIPEGLVYRLAPEKVPELSAEVVQKDFAFWNAYIEDLLANPEYLQDLDAQRAFSKLRNTTANIYRHRKMRREAIAAYRQSLALWPASAESLYPLLEFLWEDEQFDEARKLIDAAYADDPENEVLIQFAVINEQRREFGGRIRDLQSTLGKEPTNAEALSELLAIYANLGETNHAKEVVDSTLENFKGEVRPLRMLANYTEMTGMREQHLSAVRELVSAEPQDASARFLLARALARAGETNAAAREADEAVKLGGRRMRDAILGDPEFSALIKDGTLGPVFKPVGGTGEH